MIAGVVSGALAMGYSVAALFFLRYFAATRDRLFVLFAAAFALLAAQRVLLPFASEGAMPLLYVVRVLAFLLIIAAIIDKNRSGR
jgi:hypothetical protein